MRRLAILAVVPAAGCSIGAGSAYVGQAPLWSRSRVSSRTADRAASPARSAWWTPSAVDGPAGASSAAGHAVTAAPPLSATASVTIRTRSAR